MTFRATLDERCGARRVIEGGGFVATCTLSPAHDGMHIDEALEPAVAPWEPCAGKVRGEPCLRPLDHEGDCER